jgi:hypothetical protein
LGYAYAKIDGSYDFKFSKGPIIDIAPANRIPDVSARIYQSINGAWKMVREEPIEWDIPEDVPKNYFVPKDDIIIAPEEPVKPTTGFQFNNVGLLPIDSDHIVEGYATAHDTKEPLQVYHQPFCETLWIFGLFSAGSSVDRYKVEIATANSLAELTEVIKSNENWYPIMDTLTNFRRNNNEWVQTVLGPDAEGFYKNVDTDSEWDWLWHSLKVTWNSTNVPDGYCAFRIKKDAHNVVDTSPANYIPKFRVYNRFCYLVDREAKIEAVNPPPSNCGALTLVPNNGIGTITFKITANDPGGHVLWYYVRGTRGINADCAGNEQQPCIDIWRERKDPTKSWTGVKDQPEDFHVISPTEYMPKCPSVAYNFELWIQGSPTNCWATRLDTQLVRKECNLIVSKP